MGWAERWERGHWRVAYTPLGGRSRCQAIDDARRTLTPSQQRQLAELTSDAFMAVSVEPDENLSLDVRFFAAVARKILQRGINPLFDLGMKPTPTGVTGGELLVAAAGPLTSGHDLDESVKLDPTYEQRLWDRILSDHASLNRWLIPQPPFESMTGAEGAASRWADFLLQAPWMERPLVIELDGGQHQKAVAVDKARDRELKKAKIEVFRCDGSEVLDDHSELLRRLAALTRTPPPPDPALLAQMHRPAAATRLGIALLELLEAGALEPGGDWNIDIVDEQGWSAEDAGKVLDLFHGIGLVWGCQVAPTSLQSRAWAWRLSGIGYEQANAQPVEGWDAEVRLEPFVPAWASIGEAHRPTVVIRSACTLGALEWLPIPAVERRDVVEDDPNVAVGLRIVLRHLFGHEDFREGQLPAVLTALAGTDACVLLPTGAGKSLIYQMAGLLRPGATLVIDPLTSLIDDQERRLREDGIDRAVGIHGGKTTSASERDRLYREIARGDALFAFLTPERLQIEGFRTALASAAELRSINLAVIDEAHCVSEWGHDFRTAYLRVGRNVRLLSRGLNDLAPPLLALTGTASPAVLRDVLLELEAEPETMRVLRPSTFDRPNLSYAVSVGGQDTWVSRLRAALTTEIPSALNCELADMTRSSGSSTKSGLVFVPHTNGTFGVQEVRKHVLSALTSSAPDAGHSTTAGIYSGSAPKNWSGTWSVDKAESARRFKDNETSILVTTKAFGMGIDKPNIRWTVHVGYPGSLEGFAQEAGRAGRDRQSARCVLVASLPPEDRAQVLLDLQRSREERVSAYHSLTKADQTDLERQYFFLTNNYVGIDDEMPTLLATLDQLLEAGPGNRKSIPKKHHIGAAGSDPVEKALYRLAMLGIVDDYTVDYGGKRFVVDLDLYDAERLDDALRAFVRRVEPGRRNVREQAILRAPTEFRARAEHHLRLLLSTLYDVIEPARVRALAEMHLFATSGETDSGLRQRLLAYLSDGPLAGILSTQATSEHIDIPAVIAALNTVPADDPREWIGSAGRQLEAYPDHPVLLMIRGLGEAMLISPDETLLGTTFQAAFQGFSSYAIDAEGAELFLDWSATQLRNQQGGRGQRFIPKLYDSWVAAGLEEGPLERLEERSIARAMTGDYEAGELAWVLARRLRRLASLAGKFTHDRVGAAS